MTRLQTRGCYLTKHACLAVGIFRKSVLEYFEPFFEGENHSIEVSAVVDADAVVVAQMD